MYYLYSNGGNFIDIEKAFLNRRSNSFCIVTKNLKSGLKTFCKDSLLFKYTDLYLKYYTFDERIHCDVYLITVCRAGNEDYCKMYGIPQAIGFCAIQD